MNADKARQLLWYRNIEDDDSDGETETISQYQDDSIAEDEETESQSVNFSDVDNSDVDDSSDDFEQPTDTITETIDHVINMPMDEDTNLDKTSRAGLISLK